MACHFCLILLFVLSIPSEKNFPTIPIECNPSAKTPGNMPKPTAATKIIPIINSGMARHVFKNILANPPNEEIKKMAEKELANLTKNNK